ncbi:MAG: hypothetical protein RLZZ546_2610, partial [Bacteroidota bacterium]
MTDNHLNNKPKFEVWQPFLLSIMVVIGMLLGYKMNDKPDRLIEKVKSDEPIAIGRVEEIIRFIESRYVDTVNSEKLISSAINSMILQLDPHSVYIPKSELSDINENMDGNFRGIGIESFFLDDTVSILTIVKDSPADKAGLKQLDQIISIDDTLVAGVKKSFDQIRAMLRKNKALKIEIKRFGSNANLLMVIKSEDIKIHSADVAYMINDSIGYIQIKQFSSNTYQEFMENLEYLYDKKKMKHLVLDLRGNPGGYLPQAVKIMNQLIYEKDKLIVLTKGRNQTRQDYNTNGKAFFRFDKLAVLIDENSASGSEVIAGAIQDLDRGIIVGRRSFGKGLVQEQFNLSNGAAFRMTTARYFTPSGRSIQKEITSHDTYDQEVQNRQVNKTELSVKNENSPIFKTLQLGRKVYGGGGISPEIFVKGDSSLNSSEYYVALGHSNAFLLKAMKSKAISFTQNPDYSILTKEFQSYLKSKEKNIEFKKVSTFLLSEIL